MTRLPTLLAGLVAVVTTTAGAQAPVTISPATVCGRLFDAVIAATEVAIINALVGAETMVGQGGYRVEALPNADLMRIVRDYRRS